MGAPSAVKRLPDGLRQDLENQLKSFQSGKASLDEIMEWLDGHAAGFGLQPDDLPSRSAVHRYSQKFQAVLDRVQRSRELTNLLSEQLGPAVADGKGVMVLVEAVQGLAYDLLANTQEGTPLDPKSIRDLAQAAQLMASAQKTDADRALKVEAETLRKAAAAAKAVGRELGWSAETAATVRARILGVGKTTAAP